MANLPNKNVNPIVAALANWFCFGVLGTILLGQTNKAIFMFIAMIIGSILCVIPGIVIGVLGAIDAYQVALAVQNGEEVDENEYKMKLLYSVCKILDKKAVYKGV
jgi:hypothetical protein